MPSLPRILHSTRIPPFAPSPSLTLPVLCHTLPPLLVQVRSILEGTLFPMKAMGYFAVVTGSGNNNESIPAIQRFEKDYFSRSKMFQCVVCEGLTH